AISQAAKFEAGKQKSVKRRRTSKGATDIGESNTYQSQVVCVVAAHFLLASVSSINTEHQRGLFREALTKNYTTVSEALADGSDLVCELLLMHYAFMEAASRIDGMERWMEAQMYPGRVFALLPSDTTTARTRALTMLVSLQAAAHWSVFLSSLSAGIVPGDVVAKVSADEGSTAPHTITEKNSGTVQWYLLVDWLELVCQFADQNVIHTITSRIVAEIASPAQVSCSKAMLASAAFFETAKIRDCFVPALAEFVAEKFPKRPSTLKSLLAALVDNVGNKSKCAAAANDVISAATKAAAKKTGEAAD
ncbi:hypothetical protein FBU59_007174, partial [Linderina macrospora]